MSHTLTIAIEGADADQALAEILAIPGVQGRRESMEAGEPHRDGGVLVAIAAIVSITTGAVTVVDKIILWRDRWKKEREQKRLNIVLEDARGNRLALESATPEQIIAALDTLAS